jgi:CspA family cold shock protein
VSNARRTPGDELGLHLDEMDAALLAAVRTRLAPPSPDSVAAHENEAAHENSGHNEDQALDHVLDTTDDAVLTAIENRLRRTARMNNLPARPVGPDAPLPESEGESENIGNRESYVVTGAVKWFNAEKGYGFITLDGESTVDIFVHHSAIKMDGNRTLEAGMRVKFSISQGQTGPQAQM